MTIAKHAFLLIIVILLAAGFTGCIKNRNTDYYHPNPPQSYQRIFTEEFDHDNKGWTFDNRADSAYGLVANGYYKMVDYSVLGSNHIAVATTGASYNRNFLIQTRMKTDHAMGLIFGVSGNSYGYSLFIDDLGYYAVYKEGVNPEAIIEWQYTDNMKTGWNDIEVEQISDYWYFYINGVKVAQTPARVLTGSETGFMVLGNTTGYADYLTVRW